MAGESRIPSQSGWIGSTDASVERYIEPVLDRVGVVLGATSGTRRSLAAIGLCQLSIPVMDSIELADISQMDTSAFINTPT